MLKRNKSVVSCPKRIKVLRIFLDIDGDGVDDDLDADDDNDGIPDDEDEDDDGDGVDDEDDLEGT